MFGTNHNSRNKIFKTVYDPTNSITVRCKMIENAKTGINYLINIKDYTGGLTLLLDKDGNAMFSQMKL
ncbi:DUF6440 family protein [Clostridium bowmanii]|uniref:DUF6440 family protein n=1 Tax=Clostridium bowmanii TaxID=132925 RepID=UPI001C0DF0D9|nr:DUF6440 family protein [Clostridium bowmanii]MBU3188969.1 hypothetical protein [Clostridium bowmanii]MCA1073620.1 DUF6440 family protein [Clostridium bowmanii]